MKDKMKLEDALPLLLATFEAGLSFRFYSRGTSMLPMLHEGRDSVSLVSPEQRAPKKGEVILYRRKNGAFVLHRCIKEERDGSFTMCGDNQTLLEKGIERDAVIAVLNGYYKGEEWISADDRDYRKYVKKRMRSRLARHYKNVLRGILNRG